MKIIKYACAFPQKNRGGKWTIDLVLEENGKVEKLKGMDIENHVGAWMFLMKNNVDFIEFMEKVIERKAKNISR